MTLGARSGYDALRRSGRSSGGGGGPWALYPVMLVCLVVIVGSLGCYLLARDRTRGVAGAAGANSASGFGRAAERDVHRAILLSQLTHDYEAIMPKNVSVVVARGPGSAERRIVCYYNAPSGRNTSNELRPSDIHADLCTHINVAFASVKNNTIVTDERLIETVTEIVSLKSKNKDLKVLISIGGAGGNDGFSKMVSDHASRKDFIRSIKSFLRNYQVDGVDLDWEFPAVHGIGEFKGRERQHFSQLLREIRAEYVREKRSYLLTLACAAPQIIVDAAYDMDQINEYVDFVNIMTYDFHSYTTYTPFTGLNAPLYPRPQDKYYLATLNINYTTHLYLSKGLDRSKIVIGVPTYGHTFQLVNDDNFSIGSPANGFGSIGSMGFINYPQICEFLEMKTSAPDTVVIYDAYAKVPYLHKGLEWISFEDRQSVMEKAKFIKENNLGGAMIYSLNADDFLGTCLLKGKHVKFPLSQSIKNTLHDDGL